MKHRAQIVKANFLYYQAELTEVELLRPHVSCNNGFRFSCFIFNLGDQYNGHVSSYFQSRNQSYSLPIRINVPRLSLCFEDEHENPSNTVLVPRPVGKYLLKITECCSIFFVVDFEQVYSHQTKK